MTMLGLAVWTGFASAGTQRPAATTLKVWVMSSSNGSEGQSFDTLVQGFTKANPNVKVDVQPIPWEQAKDKMAIAVASGQGPDVIQVGLSLLPEFASAGALLDLSKQIGKYPALAPGNFTTGGAQSMKVNGKTYSVPWISDTRALFYRTDILKQAGYASAPKTWTQLKQAAVKLKARGGNNFGISLNVGDQFTPLMFTWQAGGDIYNGKTIDFKTKAFRKAIDFEASFFRSDLTPKAGPWQYDDAQGFKTGVTPMFISGPWMVDVIRKAAPEIDGKWAIALLPAYKNRLAFLGGSNLAVFSKTKNVDASLKLVSYLSTKPAQTKWFQLTNSLPATQAAIASPAINKDPMTKMFVKQLLWSRISPPIKQWDAVAQEMTRAVEQIGDGGADIPSTIDALNLKVRTLMSQG
jgi:multiple sugar transport system substrate-binding protein